MSSNPVNPTPSAPAPTESLDFVRQIAQQDLAAGKYQQVVTRFPPEPNGYLHIGHAKSICLNFGVPHDFGGRCNLRMDDTNPTKEEVEYVESIIADVHWLLDGWADHCLALKPRGATPVTQTVSGRPDFSMAGVVGSSTLDPQAAIPLEPFYASDYFAQLYEYALELIRKGQAYVCDHTPAEVDRMRGAPDKAGEPSQYRDRPVAESLELFERMKAGEFPDGTRTLRAKIDMFSANVWLRDPVLYRIRHAAHHHTGSQWCIYPMYDFAHGLSDYIEGVTHSICTLEFEVHRPLYDWILGNLDLPRPLPHQYEFARLNLTYTVMSKRKLLRLVREKHVDGWDDPRLPTICGLRRRGYPAAAIRAFCERIGVAKRENTIELALLEHFVREHLNQRARRRLAVLRPLKVVITNLPDDHVEELDAVNNPEDESAGKRRIPFSRELWIEQDDFQETPPPKYFRLKPGGEVRLKYAYIIKCDEVVKDATGKVVELRCTADLGSKTGGPTASRKVKGTLHWVSAVHAIDAEVRLYDVLFTKETPEDVPEGADFIQNLNPHSLEVVTAKCEPGLQEAVADDRYQFERLAYFGLDPDSQPGRLVFNRTVTLRDTWARIEKKRG
ncbi:glutamine--tRNA ligase [bacterium]|nr:glutamine--tRNA ligase [bacterium]